MGDSRREQAVAALEEIGARITKSGDVAELKAQIMACHPRPKIFSAEKQCSRKTRYVSQDSAWTAAKRIGNPEVRPYRCAHCGGWHNGNPPRSRGRGIG